MAFIISVPPPPVRAGKKLLGLANIFRRRINRLGKQNLRVAGKRDEVESVAGIELIERAADQLLRLVEREAPHRTGGVEHEHQFFGRDV